MKKTEGILIIFLCVVILITTNYFWLEPFVIQELESAPSTSALVERIIDGDTLVLNDTSHVRLLGINTPEKGEKYSGEATAFLFEKVFNKTVSLEFGKEKTDRYNRTLAYVHINSINVNLELVESGFANAYFPSGKDMHYQEFQNAWQQCVNENSNLCEKSKDVCAECIKIKELDVTQDFVILENICVRDCNLKGWTIKDEGRKKYTFKNKVLKMGENIKLVASDFNQKYVWTSSGDTLFLRDGEGKLVSWKKC